MGIVAGRVAGAALGYGDCCWVYRTVFWGLLTRASSGWRRGFEGFVVVLIWVVVGVLASQNGPF